MIQLVVSGTYRLFETKANHKILALKDLDGFAWIPVNGRYEILVTTHKEHAEDCVLSTGQYRLFSIVDEDDYVDLHHLELEVGPDQWQGYLLPRGLPDDRDIRNRIIPTRELLAPGDVPHFA